MKNSQANYLNDRYLSIADVLAAGGVWNKREACYVFADGSVGHFSEFTNRGSKGDKKGNWILHFVGGDQPYINWGDIYPGDNYKTLKEKKNMKKGKLVTKKGSRTPNGREKKLEIRRGKKGKGGVAGSIIYWPWSSKSVSGAFSLAEEIAARAGLELEDFFEA